MTGVILKKQPDTVSGLHCSVLKFRKSCDGIPVKLSVHDEDALVLQSGNVGEARRIE